MTLRTDQFKMKEALDHYIAIWSDPEHHWQKGMHIMYAYLETINMSKGIPHELKEKKIKELMGYIENYMNESMTTRISQVKWATERMIEILCYKLNIPLPKKPRMADGVITSNGQGQSSMVFDRSKMN